jgi:hypothetical protein
MSSIEFGEPGKYLPIQVSLWQYYNGYAKCLKTKTKTCLVQKGSAGISSRGSCLAISRLCCIKECLVGCGRQIVGNPPDFKAA